MQTRAFCAFIAAALATGAVTTSTAHADASCASFVSGLTATLNQSSGQFNLKMTIHRTDIDTVQYSEGFVALPGGSVSWPLFGYINQLFADRRSAGGNQPFDYNAADHLRIWVNPTGTVYLYNDTWHFASSYDMSCANNAMTRNIPGLGVMTLTFRWQAQIP